MLISRAVSIALSGWRFWILVATVLGVGFYDRVHFVAVPTKECPRSPPQMAVPTNQECPRCAAVPCEPVRRANTQISHRKPIHLFLKDTIHFAFEFNFLVELLQRLDRPLIFHPDSDTNLLSDSIVMGFCRHECTNWVQQQRQSKNLTRVGLFHNGDEVGSSTTLSSYHLFDFVFRNYYHSSVWQTVSTSPLRDKIVWIPNGPRKDKGFPQLPGAHLAAKLRPTLCSFLGGMSNDHGDRRSQARLALKQSMEKQGSPCLLEVVPNSFGGKRTLWEHVAVLRNSVFTLCPSGNSHETIRLFDALDAGSIPVLVGKPEFLSQLPGHPFVVLESWDEAKTALQRLVNDTVGIDKRQQDCVDFYDQLQGYFYY